MLLDISSNQYNNYKLMSQTIIPRPIAWIVTENRGILNIAPFSYFIPLSSEPASLIVSIGKKSNKEPKDTLANIKETKKCTICMVNPDSLTKMHYSSLELDSSISEAQKFDIETIKVVDNFPSMIVDTPVAYFCEFNQEIDLGGNTTPIILNIINMYIDDKIITDREKMDISYSPLARVGTSYATLGTFIDAPDMP